MSSIAANLFLAGAILSTVLPIALLVAFAVYWTRSVRRRPGGPE